jgi:hypothetical protein
VRRRAKDHQRVRPEPAETGHRPRRTTVPTPRQNLSWQTARNGQALRIPLATTGL